MKKKIVEIYESTFQELEAMCVINKAIEKFCNTQDDCNDCPFVDGHKQCRFGKIIQIISKIEKGEGV